MMRRERRLDAVTKVLLVLLLITGGKLLTTRVLSLTLRHELTQNVQLLLSMGQELVLIGLPALLMRREPSTRMGQVRGGAVLMICAAVLGLAMRALATPLTRAWTTLVSMPDSTITVAGSVYEMGLQVLALAIVPAVLEEALFRGVVLPTLLDGGSRGGAWLLTTLLFALLHGNLSALPAHLLFGGALTLAMMRTGRLAMPMMMHFVYNVSALFWQGMSSGWLIFCALALLSLMLWATMTMPRVVRVRMKRGNCLLAAVVLLGMGFLY